MVERKAYQHPLTDPPRYGGGPEKGGVKKDQHPGVRGSSSRVKLKKPGEYHAGFYENLYIFCFLTEKNSVIS
jgi:hypothetical protein